ncbi:P-type conjugative transfer protein TrbJ [Phenylobacterium sp.]|uniref:P-type conjugative transfer protein TrbJ n=1 Tax=Phenylobacterium sp. TaxID=1871053 RepID=UPI0035AE4ECB
MSRRTLLAAFAAALAGALAAPARAQLAVHDPANLAQNMLQAARALEQVQNQLASLQNEARNLRPLGLRAAGALDADLARVNALLAEAGRLARETAALRAQYDREYAYDRAATPGRALAALADARLANATEALRRTLAVQAAVRDSLATTHAQATTLARASEEAGGALEAAQAGNQLLAVQARQLADLSALLAAQGEAQALEQARAAAAAADARARLDRFLARRPR